MTLKEKILSKLGVDYAGRIKAAFEDEKPEEDTEVTEVKAEDESFGKCVMSDGTACKWEGELKEGVTLICITTDGELPAPDGVHEMEDGSKITTAAGIVTAIEKAPEGEPPPVIMTEDEVMAKATELMNQLKGEVMAEVAKQFKAMTAENAKLKVELAAVKKGAAELAQAFNLVIEDTNPIIDTTAGGGVQTFGKSKIDKQQSVYDTIAAARKS